MSKMNFTRTVKRESLRKLLLSVALLPLVYGAGDAAANDILWNNVGGQGINNGVAGITTSNFANVPVEVVVDTTAIDSIVQGVFVHANGPITVNASQNIKSVWDGIEINSEDFTGDHDPITVNSSATVTSNENSIFVFEIYGAATIDGKGTGVLDSKDHGVALNTFGAQLGDITVQNFAIVDGEDDGINIVTDGDGTVIVKNNTSIIGGSEAIYIDGTNDKVNIDISENGAISGGLDWGIYARTFDGSITVTKNGEITTTPGGDVGVDIESTTGNLDVSLNGDIKGGVFEGVRAVSGSGNIAVSGNRDISGTGDGIEARTSGAGTITIDGNKNISSTLDWGVYGRSAAGKIAVTNNLDITAQAGGDIGVDVESSTGDLVVSGNGNIKGGISEGVRAVSGSGNVAVSGNKDISGTGDGIEARTGGAGTVTIDGNKNISSTLDWGVYARSNTGKIAVTNNLDITASPAGDMGVDAVAAGKADIDISKNGKITGGVSNGIYSTTLGGNITVNSNKDITGAVDAVYLDALGGNVEFGKQGYNGEVKAGTDGINLFTNGAGTIELATNKNVTGTAGFGIYARNINGLLDLNIDAATVNGGVTGIDAANLGSGVGTIDIAAAAIVEGGTWGVVTGSSGNTMTVTNAGIIRTIGDTGLESDARAAKTGIWAFTGTTVVNNTGTILGEIDVVGGTAFTLNNDAAGIWTASAAASDFDSGNDIINNKGTINIRNGLTDLIGTEALNNQAGGKIDLSYSPLANDLVLASNFNPQDGSSVIFDIDFGANNGGDDKTSTGKGTADTIQSTKVTPIGVSKVDLRQLNVPADNFVATSGSIALIDAGGLGAVGVVDDPGVAGLMELVQSDNYVFGGFDPNSLGGGTKFVLQEDEAGGVFLRWAPNITEDTLGFSASGVLGQSESGAEANNASVAGVGGAAGAGAAGGIADSAMSQAGNNQNCGVGKDMLGDSYSDDTRAWLSGSGSRTDFDGAGSAWDAGAAFGLEKDFGGKAGMGCSDIALGAFVTLGQFGSNQLDGTAAGLGAYGKFASDSGVYGLLLGHVAWANVDGTNALFGTYNQDTITYTGYAAVGYTHAMTDSVGIDARVFGSVSHTDGDAFVFSSTLVGNGSKDDSNTIGASLGLNFDATDTTSLFTRAGVKLVSFDREMTVATIPVSVSGDTLVKTLEAGFNSQVSEDVTLSGKAYGELSKGATSYGVNGTLTFKF